MLKTLFAAIAISVIAMGTVSTYAATAPATRGTTSQGKVWVDTMGMTLYTFGKDTATKSNCNGRCALEWPPAEGQGRRKSIG